MCLIQKLVMSCKKLEASHATNPVKKLIAKLVGKQPGEILKKLYLGEEWGHPTALDAAKTKVDGYCRKYCVSCIKEKG